MFLKWLGFRLALPLHDDGGDPGGGGADASGGTSLGGGTEAPAQVDVPEFDDSAQIRFKGSDKPISVKDLRTFQSNWTRSSQEVARLREQIQRFQAEKQQAERQRAAEQQRVNQGQGQQAQPDVFAQLAQLPYLSGQDGKAMAEAITGQIRQRDQVLMAAVQEIARQRAIVEQLQGGATSQAFDAKISKWLTDGGYPNDPAVVDLAKEVYLAYEGDNLDYEFPEMFRARWEGVKRVLEAERQAKVNAARKPAFVPGRGGTVGPSRPLQLDPKLSARDSAEQIWEQFYGPGSGT